MMKKMNHVLSLAGILLGVVIFLAACGGGETTSRSPAGTATDKLQVVTDDVPFLTEKNLRIGYTLRTWEYEKEGLQLKSIIVVDGETSEELLVLDEANLPQVYKDPVLYGNRYPADKITGYYLSLQLPIPLVRTPPKSVAHLLVFLDKVSNRWLTVEGGLFAPRLNEAPLVIASPVKGDNLVFHNQATNAYHFNMMAFYHNAIYTNNRYAFDSLQFNAELTSYMINASCHEDNDCFFNFGSDLYAVADGVVVAVRNDREDNRGDTSNIRNTIQDKPDEHSGNHIILDIGGGKFARYNHCKQNSISVNVGDRVREGDVIGKLGNSGNSEDPHLHFEVNDSAAQDFFHGVPFVIKGYTKTGEINLSILSGYRTPPHAVTNAMMEEWSVFSVH